MTVVRGKNRNDNFGEGRSGAVRIFNPERQSVKRPGEPPEVASLVKWLCSDWAAFVDGLAWRVDGGLSI
ncbi:MAG: SDR family oxidoreductase [Chloroflexi bacterium]|nr:SDR family oxidoreductase [Chloroflexota bacterium]